MTSGKPNNPNHAKPGPKPGRYGDRVAKRMQKFNGMPVVDRPRNVKSFLERAQEIINNQISKLHTKASTSYLDINETRCLLELIKIQLVLDSKQQDTPQDASPELIQQALKMLAKDIKEPKDKENSEPINKKATPPKED